ncbi:hypothetical protein KUCAC02_020078 [Chaenocephalus aceratus]|uniref:Uncharacterized protein n=1 Tax=Chaenocephalus aceratus TaxID=36190 RepID=A0ACB9VRN7_CHAAC|nr:hypothetical protein KUCAC02_020078 [Chaenocephalus aceratus]
MNPIMNSTSSSNMAPHQQRTGSLHFHIRPPREGSALLRLRRRPPAKKRARPADSSSESSDSDSDWETTSDLSARRHRRFERTLNMNVFTSAEELERAQRLEERERIIREIWMNGQPDIPGTRSLNRYY